MKSIFTSVFLIFLFISNSYSCSCPQIKFINAFSYFEFIGIVEFEDFAALKKDSNLYKTSIKFKEIFKGEKTQIMINSQIGSSCGFLPTKKEDYLIYGNKNDLGLIEISFCSARNLNNSFNKESVFNLKKLREIIPFNEITENIQQINKIEIDKKLFNLTLNELLVYKVKLNSKNEIIEIKPMNNNSLKNFSELINSELKNKIKFRKQNPDIEIKEKIRNTYIILKLEKDYENEIRITRLNL